MLLQAARLLRARGLPVGVRIAGDGDPRYLERLQRESAAEDVQWLGPLRETEVIDLLRRAHFFVFPTRYYGEGQSNSLTEAIACGCVPIASRHGFNEAVVGEAALTVPSDATRGLCRRDRGDLAGALAGHVRAHAAARTRAFFDGGSDAHPARDLSARRRPEVTGCCGPRATRCKPDAARYSRRLNTYSLQPMPPAQVKSRCNSKPRRRWKSKICSGLATSKG